MTKCRSVGVASLVIALGILLSPRLATAQPPDAGTVIVYFMNEEDTDLILCTAGAEAQGTFILRAHAMKPLPITYKDDGADRVIAAFKPGQKKVCSTFVMVPGSFCVIVKCGVHELQKKEGFTAPSEKDKPINLPY